MLHSYSKIYKGQCFIPKARGLSKPQGINTSRALIHKMQKLTELEGEIEEFNNTTWKLQYSTFFLLLLFVYFWERDRTWMVEGKREREIQFETGSRLQAVSTDPNMGLELTNCKIITWAEVGHLTHWATQVPQFSTFSNGHLGQLSRL